MRRIQCLDDPRPYARLDNGPQQWMAKEVNLRAEYFTDFHHGAFLSDPLCPTRSIQIGIDAVTADNSVDEFGRFKARRQEFYKGRRFWVQMAGIFRWEGERIINAELPIDRQLRVPAHREISLLRIESFEKPKVKAGEPLRP